MPNRPDITVKSIPTDALSTPLPPATSQRAKFDMRPYFGDKDLRYVQYLFSSTYLNLVPSGVRLRAKSPVVMALWMALFAFILVTVPQLFSNLGWPVQLRVGLQIVITIASIGGGILAMFWYVDKWVVSERVIQGLENDLKDPASHYRGQNNDLKGNFWVFTINNEPVACIGMDQHLEPVFDRRSVKYVRASERPRLADAPEIATAEWKQAAHLLALADDYVRLILVGAMDLVRDAVEAVRGPTVVKEQPLFEAHKPNEASVRRLAVKTEYQGHGLSTALLKRVAFWARAHQIDYLYAETDELQGHMAEVLEKKHGYTKVSHTKLGYFQSKTVWKLDVKLWMSKELEKRQKEVEEEQIRKEEEELKEYE
ncbi:hypothetical protein DFQ28_001636 [Apophysomyces sp. BC1034]|nr:hypothetical protein DFQ30_001949 [Apophysomyces sp. BC1015]KAG0180194.1 hypothetical protein DFQ29_001060 [Apophysomyces sp. BC1021]KAG0190748.1 hypothetical protein DFQ28_001636 [Apophysomyces sp. BC1034]